MQVKQGKAEQTDYGYKLRSITISPVVDWSRENAVLKAVEAASRSGYDIFDVAAVRHLPHEQFDFAVTLRVIEW